MTTKENPSMDRADVYFDEVPDAELVELASKAVDDLCSGKRRWTMTVPPDRRDQDLIFSEIIRRFRATLAEGAPR